MEAKTKAGSSDRKSPQESVIDYFHVPSPPPSIDWEAVAAFAGRGLTREEILLKLGVRSDLTAEEEARLGLETSRGRALGSAAVKVAQYQAALDGKVTAQSHLLQLLGDGGAEQQELGEGVRVEREIIRGGEAGH